MRFVVLNKTKNGAEMHVLPNGNLSFYGKPKKFLSKETATSIAQEWAAVLPSARIVVRKVP